MSTLVFCELSRAKKVLARDAVSRRNIQSSLAHALSLVRIDMDCECYYSGVCGMFLLQLLVTSPRLDNRAPLGAGPSYVPGLLLAKSGSGGVNSTSLV